MAKKVTYVRVPVKRKDDLSKSAPKIDKAVSKGVSTVKKGVSKIAERVKKRAGRVMSELKEYRKKHKPKPRRGIRKYDNNTYTEGQ